MGHAGADVFRRHYLHQTINVDSQSAYLGSVGRGDLLNTVQLGLTSAKTNPRAPIKFSPGNLREHKGYPKQAKLVLERDSLGGTLKMECGSIKAAEHLLPERPRNTYNKLRSQSPYIQGTSRASRLERC